MVTMTVCNSPADRVTSWKLQTIWFTGNGDSFSNCSSTMDRNSDGSHFGRWTTRRNTCSAGSQATLSFFCQSARQSLLTSRPGRGMGGTNRCSALTLTWLLPVANCQRWRASGPTLRTLQECKRGVFTSAFDQSFHVLLGLCDAEHFLDGGLAGPHLVPAIMTQRAHSVFHGLLRDGRSGRAVQDERADGF